MAETFASMVTRITDITKRPELVALTKTALRTATLRAHSVDFFPRDLDSVVLTFTPPTDGSFVDLTGIYTAAPFLRTSYFLQAEDTVTLQATENLEYVTSFQHFWDNEGVRRLSVFTQLGESIRASFTAATGRARLWFYKSPNMTEGLYSSWIANNHPDELAQWAAGIVWNRTGNQEMANHSAAFVEAFKEDLLSNYLTQKI